MYKDINELYAEMMPIIKQLSGIYKVRGLDRADLEQEFAIVLIKCNDNFDASRGTSFRTFFASSCKNKVKDFWRQNKEIYYTLNDPLGNPDGGEVIDTIASDIKVKNNDYMEMLDGIEGGWVTHRWAYGETFQEIADSTGRTLSNIYRIHTNVIETVRKILGMTE